MGSASEEAPALQKRAAALQRIEEHIAWKRAFFQARPPPPPIGQLHRRQQGVTKGHSCHAAFQWALAVHQRAEDGAKGTDEGGPGSSAVMSAPAFPAFSSDTNSSTLAPASKQEAWAAQLHGEMERRNPSTDLNVRSDPTRTVIMANLHPDTAEEDLRHFADQFGRVVSVRIVRHHKTRKSRRYAFVEFGLAGEARKALQFHRKKRLRGHAIIIDKEKGRTAVGFLPKRMAAAESFLAAQAAPNGGHATALAEETRTAPAASDHREGAAEPATLPRSAPLPIPDDDDDFLNSILNS
ncbi:putative U1 small nuclear ribonucleoprotein [Leptomonas seymouri]|uniref:Putative U1 small nuclear ribonucleoprotein n=1 Tax=Leptomonas seymouri TaxID=5684 RepID=A0A0N0P5T1_LEPSE|nr:putative U1 small nuclear ribonucleoprotein [Leptomonas seymouri]|eukprot:KPI86826.1 putative U1 small nuclear ribonucleoprotein [Leptomonas seymouri]